MKILYLDESGDHNLVRIDPQYPIFVLGGVLVDSDDVREMHEELCGLKRRFFADTHLILRTSDISRNRLGFECLTDTPTRQRFYRELNDLMERLDYSVVACAVRKDRFRPAFPEPDRDLYLICLEMLAVQLYHQTAVAGTDAIIVAESRGQVLDTRLKRSWLRLLAEGAGSLSGETIRRNVRALLLRSKKVNLAGLQLADLVVGPIGRFVLGRRSNEDFRIIAGKLIRGPGAEYPDGALVVLPKEEGQDPLRSS